MSLEEIHVIAGIPTGVGVVSSLGSFGVPLREQIRETGLAAN